MLASPTCSAPPAELSDCRQRHLPPLQVGVPVCAKLAAASAAASAFLSDLSNEMKQAHLLIVAGYFDQILASDQAPIALATRCYSSTVCYRWYLRPSSSISVSPAELSIPSSPPPCRGSSPVTISSLQRLLQPFFMQPFLFAGDDVKSTTPAVSVR